MKGDRDIERESPGADGEELKEQDFPSNSKPENREISRDPGNPAPDRPEARNSRPGRARRCRICRDTPLSALVSRCREQGFSYGRTAKITGIPFGTVVHHEPHRLGLMSPRVEEACPICQQGPEVAAEVLAVRLKRWSVARIGMLAGCSYSAARHHVRRCIPEEVRRQLPDLPAFGRPRRQSQPAQIRPPSEGTAGSYDAARLADESLLARLTSVRPDRRS